MTPSEAVERAIATRRAARAFLPDPVDPALVRRLLELAAQAPSGTNMQPWKVRVLGPQSRARLEAALIAALDAPELPAAEEYRYYPERFREPYLSRRRKVGWDLYGLLGVADQFPDLVGRDLSPVLDDPEASVQEEVHFTYDDIGGAGPSTIRAIRSAQWTYAVYLPPHDQPDQGGDWELYDHRQDPQQDRNLAGDPAYRDQQRLLEQALVAQMQAKGTLPANWPPAYVPGRSRGGPA